MMTSSQTETLENTNYPGIITVPGPCTSQPKLKAGRRQQILFYFMDRFSNSTSWRTAANLAAWSDWMEARDIVVILVGDYANLLPATRFAFDLKLPFLLLADHENGLWQRYGMDLFGSNQRQNAYVLVDDTGKVRFTLGSECAAHELRAKVLLRAIDKPC
jgi:hypothetical protein